MLLPMPNSIGEHVGGPAGQDAERHIGVGHPVDHFVDGAVAAGHQDQVCAPIDGRARDVPGVIPDPWWAPDSTP